MRYVPYWLNVGSILRQYGCATRVTTLGSGSQFVWIWSVNGLSVCMLCCSGTTWSSNRHPTSSPSLQLLSWSRNHRRWRSTAQLRSWWSTSRRVLQAALGRFHAGRRRIILLLTFEQFHFHAATRRAVPVRRLASVHIDERTSPVLDVRQPRSATSSLAVECRRHGGRHWECLRAGSQTAV